MLMNPWFDPISGRWITPPQPSARTVEAAETLSEYQLAERKLHLDKIWDATVASATACQIESPPARETEFEDDGSRG